MNSRLPPSDGPDEAVLVRLAGSGDSEAFAVLYVHYMDPIFRYVYFRVGEQAEAEDLTEEVFVRAWEALPQYQQGKHPFKSWLYRIAHNLVIDYHRKLKPVSVPDLDLHRYHDGSPSHEERLIQDQEVDQIAQAMAKLGEEERQVLLLRFVEGLSHREVAELINKSEGACRVIQHRALAALNSALTELKQQE